MVTVLEGVLAASFAIHVVLIGICVWRVWRGENVIDRLIGADLIATLVLALLVLVALQRRDAIYVLIALGLAALGFVATIALAKYVVDDRMY